MIKLEKKHWLFLLLGGMILLIVAGLIFTLVFPMFSVPGDYGPEFIYGHEALANNHTTEYCAKFDEHINLTTGFYTNYNIISYIVVTVLFVLFALFSVFETIVNFKIFGTDETKVKKYSIASSIVVGLIGVVMFFVMLTATIETNIAVAGIDLGSVLAAFMVLLSAGCYIFFSYLMYKGFATGFVNDGSEDSEILEETDTDLDLDINDLLGGTSGNGDDGFNIDNLLKDIDLGSN